MDQKGDPNYALCIPTKHKSTYAQLCLMDNYRTTLNGPVRPFDVLISYLILLHGCSHALRSTRGLKLYRKLVFRNETLFADTILFELAFHTFDLGRYCWILVNYHLSNIMKIAHNIRLPDEAAVDTGLAKISFDNANKFARQWAGLLDAYLHVYETEWRTVHVDVSKSTKEEMAIIKSLEPAYLRTLKRYIGCIVQVCFLVKLRHDTPTNVREKLISDVGFMWDAIYHLRQLKDVMVAAKTDKYFQYERVMTLANAAFHKSMADLYRNEAEPDLEQWCLAQTRDPWFDLEKKTNAELLVKTSNAAVVKPGSSQPKIEQRFCLPIKDDYPWIMRIQLTDLSNASCFPFFLFHTE